MRNLPDTLPDGWAVRRLGTFAKVTAGGTPRRDTPAYWEGDVPWVTTGEIDFNTILKTREHISGEGVANSSAKLFPKGTLLMAMFGQGVTRGKVAMLGVDGTFNQACVAIEPRDGITRRFLFHYLTHIYEFIRSLANTGSQANLNASLIRGLDIIVPSESDATYICGVADCFTEAASRMTGLLRRKRALKRGLLQKLLTGEQRFPEFQAEPWIECRVGDALQETSRLVDWDDEEHYRLASIRRGSRGLFDRGSLLGRDIKVKKLHTIREGDFLISHIQAAYGAMGTVPKEFDGAKVSDMYSILTPKTPGCIDMRFVNYLSQRKEMRHMAYLSSNGFFAERLRLNFDPHDFLNRKLLLPPTVEEQSKIADVLENLDREIELLTDLHGALQEQKKGLMQQLLTGKVRVPESMLEPQEVS